MPRPGIDPGKRIRIVRLTTLCVASAWLFVANCAVAATHPNHAVLARAHVAFDVGDYPAAVAYLEPLLAADVPGGENGSVSLVMIFSTAISLLGSAPTNSASNSRPSAIVTLTLLARAITCSFVRTWP